MPSDKERSILEKSITLFGKVPKQIDNAPTLWPGLELFYEAFMELSSCRPVGFSEGPIPWTAIKEWCNEHDVQGEQRERVFYHVRAMDVAYLQHASKKQKQSEAATQSRNKPRMKP